MAAGWHDGLGGALAAQPLLLGGFAAALVAAAIFDLRGRRIPNALVAAILLLALVRQGGVVAAQGAVLSDPAGLLVLAVVLAGLFVLFATAIMGAGDVKLIAACILFLGLDAMSGFLLAVAIAGGALAVTWILRGALPPPVRPADPRLPYGVAIAGGGLLVIGLPLLAAWTSAGGG